MSSPSPPTDAGSPRAGPTAPIRLWPVPDVTKPPLHTLPLDVLLARLRTHTNLRAVADPAIVNRLQARAWALPRLGQAAGVVMALFLSRDRRA